MRSSGRRVGQLVFFMDETFVKAYDAIMKDKNIDCLESYLLCRYINKYERYGCVETSDSKDAEFLKIDRHYVSNKRMHLENLGYIKSYAGKGKKTIIQISIDILNKVGIKIKQQ